MQVFGNLVSAPEKRIATNSRKPFYTFRLGENNGKDEYRTTTWYSVTCYLPEEQIELLKKGSFVKVTGRLEVSMYKNREDQTVASLNLRAVAVELVEKKSNDNASAAPAASSAPAAPPRADYEEFDDEAAPF